MNKSHFTAKRRQMHAMTDTDLKITQQELDNQQILLTIEVPQEQVEKELRTTARRMSNSFRFHGFRPGKAPYHVVVQRLGREALLDEVAEKLSDQIFIQALERAGLKPYAQPVLREITYDPLTYVIEIPMAPDVDPGDYRSIRIPAEEVDEAELDRRVQAEIDHILEEHTTWVPVERPVQYGDLVTISIRVTVDEEVVLENDDWDIVPDEEEYTLAPEFDAAFIGMEVGESKSFSAHFPEEGGSAWAGQEGHFEVEVKGIKAEEAPVLDDELAAEVSNFETAEEWRQDVREHMRSHLEEEAERRFEEKLEEALLAQATLSYPPAAVDREINMREAEQENVLKAYGFDDLEEYLDITGRTREEFREELRPGAERRLKRNLIFEAIAEAEQFPASDYEQRQYLSDILEPGDPELDHYLDVLERDEDYRQFIRGILLRRKAHDFMLAVARGEEVPAPGEHVADEAPPETEETLETLEDEIGAALELQPESEAPSQRGVETEATLAAEPSEEAKAES